jgi:protein SCO1/2
MESSNELIGIRRTLLVGLSAGAVGMLVAARRTDAPDARSVRRVEWTPGQIPNPVVHTHDGRKVRFYDDLIRDKVVAINMTYLSCSGICPAATGNLLRVQRLLGDRAGRDVHMYSITLTPELDTPRALRAHVERLGIGPGWTFLTGDPDDIESLRFSLGFYDPNPVVDADRTQHAGTIRVGDAARDRWAMAAGLAAPEQILATINHLSRRHTIAQA